MQPSAVEIEAQLGSRMHLVFVIISVLIFTADAVDIRVYLHNLDCRGSYAACINANPGECCSTQDVGGSVSLVEIPLNWDIEAEVFQLPGCERVLPQIYLYPHDQTHVCVGTGHPYGSDGLLGSARYFFRDSTRRARRDRADIYNLWTSNAKTKKTILRKAEKGCRRANKLVLNDGASLDLTDLNDERYLQ